MVTCRRVRSVGWSFLTSRPLAFLASAEALQEVGQDFEVTRERIRQIEAKALRKLRHPSRSKRLRSFVEGGT